MRTWTVVLAVVVTACGIPFETEPEAVEVEVAVAADDATPTPGDVAAVSVYLVRDNALVHVTRNLPSPPASGVIFESLLGPVAEPEQRAGLRTAIPPDTQVIALKEDGTLLQIDLSREFASVGGEEEILAVAQIVLTASSIEGIDLVTFALDGVPTGVPVASGALSDNPVGARDYESLVGP